MKFIFVLLAVLLCTDCGLKAQEWSTTDWNTGHEISQIATSGDSVFGCAYYRGVFLASVQDLVAPTIIFDLEEVQLGQDERTGFRFWDPTTGSFNPSYFVVENVRNLNELGYLLRYNSSTQTTSFVTNSIGDTLRGSTDPNTGSANFLGPADQLYEAISSSAYEYSSDNGETWASYASSIGDTSCSAIAHALDFPMRLTGTPWHLIESAGSTILVIHSSGKTVESDYLLFEAQPCNQLSIQAAFATDESRIALKDQRGRLHVSGNGGESWATLPRTRHIFSLSSHYGLIVDHGSNGSNIDRVDFTTGELRPFTVSNGSITDTLSSVAVNDSAIVGIGFRGIWRKLNPSSPWQMEVVPAVKMLNANACGPRSELLSLQVPYAVTIVKDSEPTSYIDVPFDGSPVHRIVVQDSLMIVYRRQTLTQKGVSPPTSTKIVIGSNVIDFEKEQPPLLSESRVGPGIATIATDVFCFESGFLRKRQPVSERWIVVDSSEYGPQAHPTTLLNSTDTSLLLVLENGSHLGVPKEGFLSESSGLDLPKSELGLEFLFPEITSISARPGGVTLGYGIYDQFEPYMGPVAVDAEYDTRSVSAHDSLTSGQFCIAVSSLKSGLLSNVVQRRTISNIGVTHGPVYHQVWSFTKNRWELTNVTEHLSDILEYVAAGFDGDGTLYLSGRGIDSVLVSHPPYEVVSWIPSPSLADNEFPTALGVTEERLYLGTNRDLYTLPLVNTGVDVEINELRGVEFRPFPNPTKESVSVGIFNSGVEGTYKLQLVDLSGRLLKDYSDELRGATGMYVERSLSLSEVPGGYYLIVLEIGGLTKSRPLIITK